MKWKEFLEKANSGPLTRKPSGKLVDILVTPAKTDYLLNSSVNEIETVFESNRDKVAVQESKPFLEVELAEAGTFFHIIIAGLSVGAGIVATEMLKEAGKDLWKGFKKLLLPTNKQKACPKEPGFGDTVAITIQIEGIERTIRLDNIGHGKEGEIQNLFEVQIVNTYKSIIKDLKKAPNKANSAGAKKPRG